MRERLLAENRCFFYAVPYDVRRIFFWRGKAYMAPQIEAVSHSDLSPDAVASWFVVHTRSRHEQAVADLLRTKGIVAYLPRHEVWSRRRDRRMKIEVPLFPGYLFVGAAEGELPLSDVLHSRGVVRLLGVKGVPQPVPHTQIESLMAMTRSGEMLHPLSRLVRGARVRVLDGPFAGVEGVFLHRGGKDHLVVSIEMLNRSVMAEFQEGQLEKISGR